MQLLYNIEDFNEIETIKVINSIVEKNNLILAFFKLTSLLFNKVIKNVLK